MFNLNTIWITLLLLSVMVVVHEYGHFLLARLFGVATPEFSVGFGPLIGKINHNGVQYSLRWILLGGFVKIAGMDIALEGSAEDLPPDAEKSFATLPLWKKITVIAAGPIFNVLFAMILMFVMFVAVGIPGGQKNDAAIVGQATPGSPAFDAGIRPGDRIVSIAELPVQKWSDIAEIISKTKSNKVPVIIERKGKKIERIIKPMYLPDYKRYLLGIGPIAQRLHRIPVGEAFIKTLQFPLVFMQGTVKVFSLMFSGKVKSEFMGPIGMVTVVDQFLQMPPMVFLYNILEFGIQISMSLFLFNMLPLPLPLLDGGWIVILLMERLFRRKFTSEQKAAAQMVGLAAVLFLGVWVAYGDLLRAFRRFFGG